MTLKSSRFDELLLSSIDEALVSLGESTKQSIRFDVENKFSLSWNEIPKSLNAFQAALEKIFGVGARLIEIQIMKNLHSKIGGSIRLEENCQLEFLSYIAAVKRTYLI